jgi:hypothetical protein
VDDERVEPRPALDLEDARNRQGIAGVGAETVNRFGRKGYESAPANDFRRLGDRGPGGRVEDPRAS